MGSRVQSLCLRERLCPRALLPSQYRSIRALSHCPEDRLLLRTLRSPVPLLRVHIMFPSRQLLEHASRPVHLWLSASLTVIQPQNRFHASRPLSSSAARQLRALPQSPIPILPQPVRREVYTLPVTAKAPSNPHHAPCRDPRAPRLVV